MELREILQKAYELSGSDIFIVPGARVTCKVKGDMVPLTDEIVKPDGTEQLVKQAYELGLDPELQVYAKNGHGFGAGNAALIRDLNTIKYSTNPYNINSMTMAAGIGALSDEDYTRRNCRVIEENRAYTVDALRALDFTVPDSRANFIFAKHARVPGAVLYEKLRARGVLVRHFTKPEIADFNRITIGTRAQMDRLLTEVRAILEEEA